MVYSLSGTMGSYNTLADAELAVLLKSRDHKAFEEVYSRYGQVLYTHALRLTRDPDDAQDILHDLFTVLWDKATELNTNIPLRAYLFKSVKNRVFDLFSRQKVRSEHLKSLQTFIDQGEWVTDDSIREKELKKVIEKEISLLPEKMRLVFEMSRKENMSHKQIAEELQLSDKTVKKQVNNAIRILRLKIHSLLVTVFFF
ncbi:RNA polymerase sigma-70 factor (ECF subfamily) [Arcticibacter tournemirensis]|nr:RNA polymerase sigma-70 factor (ECF subfamily) [Arcticibacter tournemirensis]